MKKPRKDGKPWVPVPTLNHIPYTQEILGELRKGPVTQADFPHIHHLYDKISTLRKLLPEGYSIKGEYTWKKGKLGINLRQYQYVLKTTRNTASLSATSCETSQNPVGAEIGRKLSSFSSS